MKKEKRLFKAGSFRRANRGSTRVEHVGIRFAVDRAMITPSYVAAEQASKMMQRKYDAV